MLEKTPNEIGSLFQSFERRDDMGGEFVAGFATHILQFMFFDRGPDLLIRIEFRTVGGQLFQLNEAMMFGAQKGVDRLSAMNRRAIPDHRHGRRVRLPNLPQKSHHVLAMIAAVLDVIVQVAGLRDQAHHREMPIPIPIAQHRRLPFPRPGQADAGHQIARGFIRLPDHTRGAIRRFFIPGKRVVVHVVTSASFWRWSFRTGFCRLKPRSRNRRPTLDTA